MCEKSRSLLYTDIVPSIEDLQDGAVQANVICDVTGCGISLTHSVALGMHKKKAHGIITSQSPKDKDETQTKTLPKRFFCPSVGCLYNRKGSRHFKTMQNLKQHFLKVHGEKKYTCDTCLKAFAIESDMLRHKPICGVIYKCETCNCPYTTKEALQTHCMRKRHVYPEKYREKSDSNISRKKGSKRASCCNAAPSPVIIIQPQAIIYLLPTSAPVVPVGNMPQKILPKLNLLPATAYNSVKGTANETSSSVSADSSLSSVVIAKDGALASNPLVDREETNHAEHLHHISIGVQVGKQHHMKDARKKLPKNVQATQTTGDYILKQAMQSASIPVRSMGSQISPKTPRKRKINSCQTQILQDASSSKKKKSPKVSQTSQYSQAQGVYAGVGNDVVDLGTDTQTQTLALLEELEKNLAETISTQTLESFLAGDAIIQHCGSVTGPIPCVVDSSSQPSTNVGASVKDSFPKDLQNVINIPETANSLSCSMHTGIQTTIEGIDLDLDSILGHDDPQTVSSSDPVLCMTSETQTADTILDQFLSSIHTQTTNDTIFENLLLQDTTSSSVHMQNESSATHESVEIQTRLHANMACDRLNIVSSDMETQTLFPELDGLNLPNTNTQSASWSNLRL